MLNSRIDREYKELLGCIEVLFQVKDEKKVIKLNTPGKAVKKTAS